MSDRLPVTFAEGTHRSADPGQTLARILPLLTEMGITRAADVTGLDRIGIPTWCAIRPAARLMQVSNGKGLSHEAARVSALMEAIELWHAEHPGGVLRRASMSELSAEGLKYASFSSLPGYWKESFITPRRVIDWVRGENILDQSPVWLPACLAYLIEPTYFDYSSNGLAAGNDLTEATLHALYELIERDSVRRLFSGKLSLPKGESRVVDLDTLPTGPLSLLRDRLSDARIGLTLIRVAGRVSVSTFFAAIVDPDCEFACSFVNIGQGSHLSPSVAAARAVTEAAQSRLTYIHGSREDLEPGSYIFDGAHNRLRTFFEGQRADLDWEEIEDRSSGDLREDLNTVMNDLRGAGHTRIYRVELTKPRLGIPVAKLVVPGLRPPMRH